MNRESFDPEIVVELAAGYGRNKATFLKWLLHCNNMCSPRYIGVDIVPENRDMAITHEGFAERDFVVANLIGWDYLDGVNNEITSIDLVIIWDTLCYFNEGEIDHILSSLKLSPMGRVLVSEPKGMSVREETDHCTKRPFGWYEDLFRRNDFEILNNITHEKEDVLNELTEGVLGAPTARSWLLMKKRSEDS
jgi:hypothetical protein